MVSEMGSWDLTNILKSEYLVKSSELCVFCVFRVFRVFRYIH